jgi:tRNA(Ile)-lysidine synthase
LLLGLAALREPLKLTLYVATIDHGLRPESARDALYVERLSRALRLPCDRRRVELDRSSEAAARTARYAALEDVARLRAIDFIATGHTLEDQVETVLMRLGTGSGTAGAQGIHRQRGSIVRPLLDVSRSEVRDFLRSHRVRGRADPTNEHDCFTRNRVRHEVLPALVSALGAAALPAIARFAEIASRDEACLNAFARASSEAFGSVETFRALDPALRFRILRNSASALGTSIDFDAFERIDRALASVAPVCVALPNRVEFRVRYGRFELVRSEAVSRPSTPSTPLLIDGPFEGFFRGHRVAVRALVPFEKSAPDAVAIDAAFERLSWPLQIRTRRPGDVFAPVAGAGHKKLKAWLIDTKIPREQRDELVLLTDSAGEVLWIVGLRQSRWTCREVGPRGGVEVSIRASGS